MNVIANTLRPLVERKLWPLAVLLLAGLAAVPMLLGKEEAVPVPPPTAVTANAAGAQAPTQPIVTLGAPEQREVRRKVLGASKNPFKPAKAKKADVGTSDATAPKKDGDAAGSTAGGTAAPAAGTVQVVAPLPKKKPAYELFSLRVRFGPSINEKLGRRTIKRLTALPRMSDPVLVYLGLKKDLKTAVFLVDASTLVVGDGKCVPSPQNCQTLEMQKGETAFVDVLNEEGGSIAQYQLDMVGVIRKRTTDARAAAASRKAVAKGGRDVLRARASRINGYKYDPSSGTVERDQ